MTVDRTDLWRALGTVRPYLLSHHLPGQRHRCHTLRLRGRRIDLCARCSGVYPGIVVGLVVFATGVGRSAWPWVIAGFPAPALADWAATTIGDRRGSNAVRTATGALLGTAYGLALPWFLVAPRLWLLGVAVAYGGVAALGLWASGLASRSG